MSALSAAEALAFVRAHGVVLVSAKGRGPNLVEAIAGEAVEGSWWGRADGKRIFAVLSEVAESDEVLVCRLVDGKVTLVHRRLWPALVRLADAFDPVRIARVLDGHTASGRHVSRSMPFPDWVPPAIAREAQSLAEADARDVLAAWLPERAAP
ncbi:MAG TPA: hypothetical protein VLD35_01170, partial [Caldimonas sp.]|nr:hypothetical protein [Caldimonas sp.]